MQDEKPLEDHVFEDLLRYCVVCILRDEDPEAFLTWIKSAIPTLLPDLAEQVDDPAMRDSFFIMLGRAIWNATPLPSNRFRPRPLSEPGRNDPCICGSGHKFKHCCGNIPSLDFPLEPELMLTLVLDRLPVKQLATLPFNYLSPEAIAAIATEWVQNNDAARAVKLLEAYFANTKNPDARAEGCLDTLLDAYNVLRRPRKKQALIDKMLQSPVKELRATAIQRQCLMEIDARNFKAAWALFHRCQREFPDNPLLANLEIMLLLEEGRANEAAERARFWLARLRRQPGDLNPALLEFLEQISQDPNAAFLDLQDRQIPGLKQLETIISRAQPPAKTLYQIREHGDLAEWIEKAQVDALLARWERVFPLAMLMHDDPDEVFSAIWDETVSEHWLAFLERTPEALNVIEIIAGLLQALELFPEHEMNWAETKLRLPLLEQAYAIIDKTIRGAKNDKPLLAWGIWENRLPLSLISGLISTYTRQQRWREALPLLERMVLTLNPDDNQGLREFLSSAYLYCLQPDKVLSMGFEEDMLAGTVYNRVLALYTLGRLEEAETALAYARTSLPQVYKFLCAESVKQPPLAPGYVSYGGKDQAWYYRQINLPLWERANALDWLRAKRKRGKTGTSRKCKQHG